jgi:hypothetical protein
MFKTKMKTFEVSVEVFIHEAESCAVGVLSDSESFCSRFMSKVFVPFYFYLFRLKLIERFSCKP